MTPTMEKSFRRSFNSLQEIFTFLNQFMRSHMIQEETIRSMELVVEEVFTNFVKYNPHGPDNIVIGLEKRGNELSISFVDPQTHPFDITRTAEVDVDRPLEERKPGGLGIHLVKSMTDSIAYQHQDGKSTIIVTKRLE